MIVCEDAAERVTLRVLPEACQMYMKSNTDIFCLREGRTSDSQIQTVECCNDPT